MKKLAILTSLLLTLSWARAVEITWTDYVYDGNGNVTELLDGETGEVIGKYEYDPYENTTKIEGKAAHANKFRFSTKEYNETTGLHYYGYRHYDPVAGRWPFRDPIEEKGGRNIYAFVGNNGINKYDKLGMAECRVRFDCTLKPDAPEPGLPIMVNCKYICTENSRVPIGGFFDRTTIGPCDKIPAAPMIIPESDTQFCGCKPTIKITKSFGSKSLKLPCSKSECRAGCDFAHFIPAKVKHPAIRAAAEVAKAACYDTRNAICSKR